MTTKQKIFAAVVSVIVAIATALGIYKIWQHKKKSVANINSPIGNLNPNDSDELSNSEDSESESDEDEDEDEDKDKGGEEGSGEVSKEVSKEVSEEGGNKDGEDDKNNAPLQSDNSLNAALIQAGQDVQSEILNNKSLNTDPKNDNANRRTSFESNAILSTSENDEQDTNQEKEKNNDETYKAALAKFNSAADEIIKSAKNFRDERANMDNNNQSALENHQHNWMQTDLKVYNEAAKQFIDIANSTGNEKDAKILKEQVRNTLKEILKDVNKKTKTENTALTEGKNAKVEEVKKTDNQEEPENVWQKIKTASKTLLIEDSK